MRIIKFLTLMMLMLGMSVGLVHAEDSYGTLIIDEKTPGHEFYAYQIFSGTVDTKTKILTNINWGTGISPDFAKDHNPVEYAKKIDQDETSNYEELADHLTDQAIKSEYDADVQQYKIRNMDDGYYLIIDKGNEKVRDYSRYLVKNICRCILNIEPKHDEPKAIKKVQENKKEVSFDEEKNLTEESLGKDYNDVADYSIGDDVPFELIGTMPNTLDDFKTYKYVFHDTLSNGLDYNENSLKVTLDDQNVTNQFKKDYNDHQLIIGCDNVKALKGITTKSEIRVTYTAKLNSQAVVGLNGNPNTMYLEYSNNPNKGNEGTTGKTPEDVVVVLTYGLKGTKVDQATQKPLAGAKFKLYRKVNKKDQYAVITDGKVTSWNDEGTEIASTQDGTFKVAGLDDGAYYLKETAAPDGYDVLAEDAMFTIKADTQNDQNYDGDAAKALKSLTVKMNDQEMDGSKESGMVSVIVADVSEIKLPEAGSRGALILAILGVVMMGAGAMYLLKKKND